MSRVCNSTHNTYYIPDTSKHRQSPVNKLYLGYLCTNWESHTIYDQMDKVISDRCKTEENKIMDESRGPQTFWSQDPFSCQTPKAFMYMGYISVSNYHFRNSFYFIHYSKLKNGICLFNTSCGNTMFNTESTK